MTRLKRIHINKHVIAANRRHGRNDPPISVKVGKENIRAHRVIVAGECEVIHRPDKPLKCGARVWIETYGDLLLTLADGKRRGIA